MAGSAVPLGDQQVYARRRRIRPGQGLGRYWPRPVSLTCAGTAVVVSSNAAS